MTSNFASKMLRQTLLMAGLALAISACSKPATEAPAAADVANTSADSIFFGGDILTMQGDNPTYAEAVAVKDGKIVFVGSKADAQKMQGSATAMNDLMGKTLLPGFIDGHSHYINSLSVANQAKLYAPPAGPGKDVDSIIATLKDFAAKRNIPKGEIIIGYGYDDTVMPNGRLLNRDDLDAAFPDNPVRIDHVSMHGTVLNSMAMKLFGFDANTKTPPGGVIVRKPGSNEPYGLIMETAFLPVFEKTPTMTPEQEIAGTKAGQMMYAETGITTAHEGATHLANLQTMKRATDAGANIIDVVAYPFITDLDKILVEFPAASWGKYDRHFKIGGAKITSDGSPQGRTAYFSTPYLTGGPGGEKNWRGEPTFPAETLQAMLKKVYDLNVPLTYHANGDAAIDMLIKAHETIAADDLGKDRNVTIIHAQFTRKDHIQKFVEYKFRPSFYTLHTYYFSAAHIANRGKEQAMYISPMRDAIDAGLHPTNHTDAVVAPLDQMFMLWSAVNRISRGGAEIGPDQRVTPYEGLKTMTIWGAEQYGEQDSKGSLESGKLADLVILDKNPLKVEPNAIKDIQVLETLKEGKSVYQRAQ
jgi:predicted amidohydrolase YtcJ